MKTSRSVALALAAVCLSAAAHAQPLSHVASLRSSDPVEPYLEAWGRNGQYRLIDLQTSAYSSLFDRPGAVSQAALSGNENVQATIGYDLGVVPYASNIQGTYAMASYRTGTISMVLNTGGAQATVTDAAMLTQVEQSSDGSSFLMHRRTSTVEGMLPGNSIAYTDPSPQTQAVDLTNLLRFSAAGGSPFDLAGFSTLPVRLTSPSSYVPVYISLTGLGGHVAGEPWSAALPNPLDLQRFGGMFINIFFDGVYTVSVQPGDYANAVDYQRASSWVDTNLRQINYEFGLSYEVRTLQLSAVPEPAPAALLLAGLAGLAVASERKRRRTTRTPP